MGPEVFGATVKCAFCLSSVLFKRKGGIVKDFLLSFMLKVLFRAAFTKKIIKY